MKNNMGGATTTGSEVIKMLKTPIANHSNDDVADFIDELIEVAVKGKKLLILAVSNIHDPFSAALIERLKCSEGEGEAKIVLLLKQNINVDIKATIMQCNAIADQLPFSTLMVAGDDSYVIARSGEISGCINNKEAAASAKEIINEVINLYV